MHIGESARNHFTRRGGPSDEEHRERGGRSYLAEKVSKRVPASILFSQAAVFTPLREQATYPNPPSTRR
jgi:hypothetical protein